MTFLYFGYGSNMLPARLWERCPSARFICRANAVGFRLEFSKVSIDESGKATLVKAENAVAPGALFEIAKSELGALDVAEGAGYERQDKFDVEVAETGKRVTAKTYIGSAINRKLKPYDWYLALVVAGASHHDLGEEYLSSLRSFEYLIDAHLDRKARRTALAALQSHDIADYRILLQSG